MMIKNTFIKLYSLILLTCFAATSGLAQYCDAVSLTDFPPYEFAISNVTLGTINNDSDLSLPVSGGYEPYMGFTPVPDLEQGSTVPITITLKGPGLLLPINVWVFIDWNGDGDFEEANEDLFIGTASSPNPTFTITEDINVPVSATPGNTRMRVVATFESGNIQPPCDNNSDFFGDPGEVEDYTINVTAPVLNYCDAVSLIYANNVEFAITNVSLGTIDNDSDPSLPFSDNYENYTSLTPIPDLQQVTTTPISITLRGPGLLIGIYVRVFIDWNGDGDFEEANEALIFNQQVFSPNPTFTITNDINVPVSASPGNTRMRVVATFENGNIQPPCDSNGTFVGDPGEVEDYTINVTPAPVPDADTEVNAPVTQVPSSSITADVAVNVTNNVEVLRFEVADQGTSDGYPTEITRLRFVPGPSNTASWSQHIQGIRITNTNTSTFIGQGSQSVSISDTEIIVDITSNNGTMTVPDGSSVVYSIGIFLKSSGIEDETNIQLAVPTSTQDWQTPAFNSSSFEPTFSGVTGNVFDIDVVGNTYAFITQPINAIINQPMTVNVQIAYIDNNGNADHSFTSNVEITSSGSLVTTPLNATPINGVVTFSGTNIIHNAGGNNITLTASSAAFFPNLISNPFDVITTPEVFITEIADPDISGGPGKYAEIYNAGVTAIDLSVANYYLWREANGGGTPSRYEVNQLDGVILPKSYHILSLDNQTNFYNLYGTSTNYVGTLLGNGNDSYFLSYSGTNETVGIANLFDIYGEIGVNGYGPGDLNATSNTGATGPDEPWEYENRRAYRRNPNVTNANDTWTASEWEVVPGTLTETDMTPGFGDNDYIYTDDTDGWNSVLPNSGINFGIGNPNGISTTSQNIFVKSGTATLNTDTSIGDLVVRSGATLVINPGVKLTVTGDIVNQGTIIFESDDNSTAVLEAVQPNTRVVGNGFEVHRRIPVQSGFRAFRYLSSSVTTPAVAQGGSVYDNWQQGGLNPGDSGYQSGFGTHITGTNVGEGLGFDPTPSGNPSMYYYDPNLVQPWQSIPNTNNTTFSAGDAYAILIRGDRNSPLNTNDQTGDPTTLRTTGRIYTGNYSVPNLSNTVGHFNLVGNPYQSQVDLVDLLKNNSVDVDDNYAYVWDPRIGTLGGNVTINLNTLGISAIPLGETVPVTSDANQYLQPQQAFFVETIGNNPQITFRESTKNNATGQTEVFSSDTDTPAQLDITLKSAQGRTYDGLRIVYDNAYANAIDQYDAVKLWNYTDNLAVLSQQNYLSIEKRSIPTVDEVTPIYFGGHSMGDYTFDIHFSDQAEFSAYLVDHYIEESIALPMGSIFSYEFNVDANIPSTLAQDRFEITYDVSNLSSEDFNTSQLRIYPNPVDVNTHLNIQLSHPNSATIESIALLNLNGQIVEDFQASEIDFSGTVVPLQFKTKHSTGTYLLRIKTDKNVSTHKIIIK